LIQLAEPRLDLLAEPRVMVEVVLHKLAHILFRVAVVLRSDLRQLGLKLRGKIDFRRRRLGP
jgi:hypothetical protein